MDWPIPGVSFNAVACYHGGLYVGLVLTDAVFAVFLPVFRGFYILCLSYIGFGPFFTVFFVGTGLLCGGFSVSYTPLFVGVFYSR